MGIRRNMNRLMGTKGGQIFRDSKRKIHHLVGESSSSFLMTEPLVISGISGRFPSADNMAMFKDNLLNGVDMVKEQTRWLSEKVPRRWGLLDRLDKFDATFFGIPTKMADAMDPAQRMLLEVTFEAIIDAGINPSSMSNSRTGVFVGAVGGESKDYRLHKVEDAAIDGYGAMGFMNFVLPNRITYHFNFHGPSLLVSTGCSSSLIALEAAVNAIKLGKCDAAIVGGACVHLNPSETFELLALKAVTPDGKCRTFDHKANGYVRSEAVTAILVQKAKDARRSYGQIKSLWSNSDGYKDKGMTYPSGEVQQMLLREAYRQADADPGALEYLEAHGTGTPAGDPQEVEAVYRVLCQAETRMEPLLIGSVKTNMGHGESAAGICSIAKIAVMNQTKTFPANLHFEKLNPELEPFFDGSLKIVTEPTDYKGGLVGINSFGMGGANAHLILETEQQAKDKVTTDLPILIPISGRTEEKVQLSLKDAEKEGGMNLEFASLLQHAYQDHIPGNGFRGYTVVNRDSNTSVRKVENCEGNMNRPLWIVFSGMGSQWNEMGKDMMKLDVFAESMIQSRATVKNLGVDLEELLKPGNGEIFENVRSAALSISAVQIALYDTLKSLGISPDGFFGHSMGEAMCGYADGCLTAEELIRLNDARGRAFEETRKPGSMAVVYLPWSEVVNRCPPEVYPACHNGASNVSVAGSPEALRDFIKQLREEGIVATEVNSCNVAPHTPYVRTAGELLRKYSSEIIPDKRPRSTRWISTSIPEEDWDTELAQYSSVDYFANNLITNVLFYQAVKKIPEKAVVIEVGPKALFQALLKESVPRNCVHIAPMHPKVKDKVEHFLQSVGNMYASGVDLKISELYPKVSFPVAASTPFTGPSVRWDHERSWNTSVLTYPKFDGKIKTVNIQDTKDRFLEGHKLDERMVFPAAGYLVMAWQNFSDAMGKHFERFPVRFSNVFFERATFLDVNKPMELTFSMLEGGKSFEIKEEGAVVVRGSIAHVEAANESHEAQLLHHFQGNMTKKIFMSSDDIYKELRLRGYSYNGQFKGITTIDTLGTQAKLAWHGNWVTLLDTALQTMSLSTMTRNTLVPARLEEVIINPQELLNYAQTTECNESPLTLPVKIAKELGTVELPGVRIKGLTATVVPRSRHAENLAFERHTFRPHFGASCKGVTEAVAHLVDVMVENSMTKGFKILDTFEDHSQGIYEAVHTSFSLKPQRQVDITVMTLETEAHKIKENLRNRLKIVTKVAVDELLPESTWDAICISNVDSLPAALEHSEYVLLRSFAERSFKMPDNACLLTSMVVQSIEFNLLRKKVNTDDLSIVHLPIESNSLSWLEPLKREVSKLAGSKTPSRLYLTAQNEPDNGILGLVNCLRQEPGGENIRCIFDPEGKLNLNFQNPSPALSSILQHDLVMNVFKNYKLGSYRQLPLKEEGSGTKLVEHAFVNTLTVGDLTSLRWIESPLKFQNSVLKDFELCKVAFAAMNFRDVMLATGKLPLDASESHRDCVMGLEFSGYNDAGRRVMGMTSSKALATSVSVRSQLVWPIPEFWTLEDAATVPIVYSTAYYAMYTRGRLTPGQSILIHSGTGGVGQAAISIALANDCEVFTTVGTPEKRDYILKLFPQLKLENVGNSRDCSFEEMVMHRTNGKGVDLVLNSLAEEKLQASVRCLGMNGKFLEIGAFDASQNNPLGMRSLLKNTEFHGVYLKHVLESSNRDIEMLRQTVMDGIKTGVVKPLPRHTFKNDQIEEAFRFMASGHHLGKVLIQVRDEALGPEQPVQVPAIPRSYFHPQKTYVIIGGLGGLGLEVANWLVDRGARHLVLPSRSGVTTGYQHLCLRKWIEAGVKVETPVIDLTQPQVCDSWFHELIRNNTLGGIFNSSVVLKDAMIENQNEEMFRQVCAPKIGITRQLDQLTRKHVPGLDYFVTFSSGVSSRGNAGQSNYGFANSAMERMCEQRVNDGLHGLSIQWGVIGDVGVLAEKSQDCEESVDVFQGTLPQPVASCLEVLEVALQQPNPVCSSMIIDNKFEKHNYTSNLIQRMAQIFGIKEVSKICDDTKLTELGMDSLIAVELRQTLEREFDLPLTAPQVRTLTFRHLKAIVAGTYSVNETGPQKKSVCEEDSPNF